MATLSEIEIEITALTKRHSDLDSRLARFGTVDQAVGSAMGLVDRQLAELQRRKTHVLAGKPDPADAAKPAPSATPAQLRPPRWISSKETRETAAEVHAKNVEIARSLPLETPVDDLVSLYETEAYVAVFERALRGCADEIVENGRPCEFSEGMFAAILSMLCVESATTAAAFQWAGNQRKLLAQRVEALESRRQDKLTSLQIQHLEHYLSPIFEAEVAKATAPLLTRIAELESHPPIKYVGTWQAGRDYKVGNLCTDRGSLFHANSTTRQRPGDGTSWTLVAKRGQDGKDK